VRIISGSARGRKLGHFNVDGIRPTSDRVREAVFSILFSRQGSCEGKTVLDIYAGSGAMAIEALSRGARHATLVDLDRRAERLIKQNLAHCGLAERATVIRCPADVALRKMESVAPFDLVFLDPPYGRNLVLPVLEALVGKSLLQENAIVVAESDRNDDPVAVPGGLCRLDERLYGRTRIEFFQHSDMT